jgi:4-hydroxybenzoyl-CoA thioesterase
VARSFEKEFVVRERDCTPAGSVFYPNYLKWLDQSVWDIFWYSFDLPLQHIRDRYGPERFSFGTLQLSLRFSARLDDRIELATKVTYIHRYAIGLQHSAYCAGKDLLTASETRLWTATVAEGGQEEIADEVFQRLSLQMTFAV